MHLCACVSEERGNGEGAGSQALSDTLRYINLAGLATGLVASRLRPMHLCPTSRLFLSPTSRPFCEVAKPYDLTVSFQSVVDATEGGVLTIRFLGFFFESQFFCTCDDLESAFRLALYCPLHG
jgi:hypothetical protein